MKKQITVILLSAMLLNGCASGRMGNPGSIYVRVVAYDKNKTAHTIVSKSPEIGVGASYETPVIDKDYAKYTVSIMAASTDGTYSIRYHD